MSVEETLREIVTRIVRKTPADFNRKTTFKDLNADSLDIVQILVALEDKYDIEIDNEELAEAKDMGDFITYLEGKIGDQPSKLGQ
jgi:acyl carrier protein